MLKISNKVEDHFVYIITPEFENKHVVFNKKIYVPIKIGVSSNVENRIKSLQTGSFLKLQVIGTLGPYTRSHAFYLEKKLHNLFNHLMGEGEWFLLTYNDISKSKSILNNLIGINHVDVLLNYLSTKSRRTLNACNKNRLYWEIAQFRKVCNKIKEENSTISSSLFWDIVEQKRKIINGYTFVKFVKMKPEDRIAIAAELFGLSTIIN